MNTKILIFIIVILFLMTMMCKRKSKKIATPSISQFTLSNFNANTLMSSDISSKSDNIQKDSTLIFYAPWCGHCKKSMQAFKEAVTKSNGKIILINSDEDPDLVKKYNVKGFPTIMKSNGEIYTGTRDVKSILNFID